MYKHREVSLDYLRVIATICVIVIHSCGVPYSLAPVNSLGFASIIFVNYGCLFAVPIFFMLSGYFILNSNSSTKIEKVINKFLNLLKVYLVWSLIYILWENKYIFSEYHYDFIKLIPLLF